MLKRYKGLRERKKPRNEHKIMGRGPNSKTTFGKRKGMLIGLGFSNGGGEHRPIQKKEGGEGKNVRSMVGVQDRNKIGGASDKECPQR